MMEVALPIWRSMLFIPAHLEKFTSRAHERGSDAVILDLEDSVPDPLKAQARAGVRAVAEGISQRGTDVIVRINSDEDLPAVSSQGATLADLEAVVCEAVRALVVPKVNGPAVLRSIASQLSLIETARGLPEGHTRLIALIEDTDALLELDAIARASPRLIGMTLGPEDFSLSAGCQPTQNALLLPSQLVLFACRRAGILPFGFPGSIGEFADLGKLRDQVMLANELGFVGALCVHPSQVRVLNEGFAPTAEEVEEARNVVAASEAALAAGRGAAGERGKMIDLPVVARAKALLRRAVRPVEGP